VRRRGKGWTVMVNLSKIYLSRLVITGKGWTVMVNLLEICYVVSWLLSPKYHSGSPTSPAPLSFQS